MSFWNKAGNLATKAWEGGIAPGGNILKELAQGALGRPKTALALGAPAAFAYGAGSSLMDKIDNTDVTEIDTFNKLESVNRLKTNATFNAAAGGLQGAVGGALMSKGGFMSKGRGALLGAAVGGLASLALPTQAMGALQVAAGAGMAFKRGASTGGGWSAGNIFNSAMFATPSLVPGIINLAGGSEYLTNKSRMNFAMDLKARDRTQDMQGPEMAQSMVGSVGGPMVFGKSTPRNYSLGATGELSLALHKMRHGGK